MFTKTALFIFCFVGIFAVLFAGITSSFYHYQASYTASAGATKEVEERFDLADATMYSQVGSDNMTFEYSSYWDHPSAPQFQAGLPSGQYLEIWWGYEYFFGMPYGALEFRHTTEQWWGLAFHRMLIYYMNGSLVGEVILDYTLENEWDSSSNSSAFQTKTPVSASYLITFNQSKYNNITQAWDGGELGYTISYELDINATQMNIWGLVGSLLTFNAPALGLTGIAGTILNALVALPFWVITGILIAKLIFAIIPFIQGLRE